ncbi:MAG: nitroreductase family protein [Bacteroidota bacterium]|nr:nitroreductase family protein [Bacteroidota bacterium]MDP4215586.1 nitroreductase family protein [Bacteroidota bacterium]MDP4246208.1 nitroreductase family protein [Bacteroidota bacterium]MDP4255516.1 nitroreductase family protein [Bacteroidota bacterium]MDP4257777.1 nitroreductase family protein [Bacteroidota bacterium]
MTTTTNPETISVILRRRSVRNYSDKPVDDEVILQLLRAAMSAPAADRQFPWKFIVIRDKEMLHYLASGLPSAEMLSEAAAAIVVCAAPQDAFAGRVEYAVMACSCASENILLAAEALGLGAVWTAIYPNPESIEFVRYELGMPASIIPFNIIPIGYPICEAPVTDRYDPDIIHWEEW